MGITNPAAYPPKAKEQGKNKKWRSHLRAGRRGTYACEKERAWNKTPAELPKKRKTSDALRQEEERGIHKNTAGSGLWRRTVRNLRKAARKG